MISASIRSCRRSTIRVVGDGDGEVLAGLVPGDRLADLDPDLAGPLQAADLHPGDEGASSFSVAASRSSRSRQGGPPGRSRRRLRRADGPGTGYGTRSLSRYASYLFGPRVPDRQ